MATPAAGAAAGAGGGAAAAGRGGGAVAVRGGGAPAAGSGPAGRAGTPRPAAKKAAAPRTGPKKTGPDRKQAGADAADAAPEKKKQEGEGKSKRDRAKEGTKKFVGTGGGARYRRILLAEFIVCLLFLALSPFSKKEGATSPVSWMKKGTALCVMFIVLGLVASGTAGMAKVSAAFGGIVTLGIAIDQRNALGRLAKLLNAPPPKDGSPGRPGGDGDIEEQPLIEEFIPGPGGGRGGVFGPGIISELPIDQELT